MLFQERVSLAPYTTFDVGGASKYFVEAKSVEDVMEALSFARAHELPVFVLGGGSNIVVADSGYPGLTLKLCIPGIEYSIKKDTMRITVGAGVIWDDLVTDVIGRGVSGLECLSGIPGTVGGAVVANLGAYGAQCSDTFLFAEVLDLEDNTNTLRVIDRDSCQFSYHDSIFGRTRGRYIVVRATFELPTHPAHVVPAYKDNRFDMQALTHKMGRVPSLQDIRQAVLEIREQKGSLIMEGRVSYKCAGSYFHMPFVNETKYAQIVTLAQKLDAHKEERLRPWAWKQPDGSYKIAPGFLLEYTEFSKGYVRGSVGISPRHTLTIINVDGAHAADIAKLARDMHDSVKNVFDIDLEREVEYVGDVE